MKNLIKTLITICVIFVLPLIVQAQAKVDDKGAVYRRSSLYTIMIEDTKRPYANVVDTTFTNAEIPEKFNNHIISDRKILTAIPPDLKNYKEKVKVQSKNISNFLNTKDIAKKMVAKWFNRTERGTFDINLIAERGYYNASEMDVELAKSSKRGNALLADAGEELIGNTFVLVNDFKYVSKEEVAKKTKGFLSVVGDVAAAAGYDDVKDVTDVTSTVVTIAGKGYVIVTTSYLYKLVWNDSIEAVFYEEYWIDEDNFDENKKAAFDNSNIFSLKLVGHEKAWADLQSSIFTNKSEEQLISMATIRAIDKVIVKLQRTYEVFRTKTPLYSAKPLAAKIGLKEGLEKGDKYEVLEQFVDKNGRTRYKRKGVIKVDHKHIWDNRYMATEEQQASGKDGEVKENYTIFKGNAKSFYKGMLIRQIN